MNIKTHNTMKKNIILILSTFVIWYTLIAFIKWDSTWIEHLSTTSNTNRTWFILCVIGKLGLDYVLWKFIMDKDRKEEDQTTYSED